MAKAPDYKKELVQGMLKLMRQYNIIGVVNMQNLPAPQLQSMRSELRGKIELFMTKKRLMKIAIGKVKDEKKNIEELVKYFEGMPALIFTNENPFKLSKILQKSRTSAPAKAGQIAPNDIVIKKGPTPFAPGPIISELGSVGLKVGVESGKVAVKEDAVIAKKGDKIKQKVAEVLARLDIKPMEVGLGLIAAYEDGIIYLKDVLEVDEKAFSKKVNLAAVQAFNLAFNIAYPTKENTALLIAKAFNDAKALGISQKILDKGIIEDLLGQAEREMLSLKASANIEAKAKEIKEESKPEEELKPGIKEEPEVKEKKIEAPTQEEIVKKEEKVLEEEKKIIEEEKKLEEEKPKDVPVEEEVQEAVKKEEEINLEKERIEKEKELERVEKQKEEIKKTGETKEAQTEDKIDKIVKEMVEKTKKFMKGEEETAAEILEEVKKEEKQEGKKEAQKPKEKEEAKEVPSAHDLKKQKEAKAQKEVEELAKELLRKGTLRKK